MAALVLAGLCCRVADGADVQMRGETASFDSELSRVEDEFEADAQDDSDVSSDEDDIEQLQGVAPLAPNEPLRPSATSTSPEASESARSMLGPPTLAGMAGGRGRARTLSRGRATAPYMVGDFFGGVPGSISQLPGGSFGLAATVNNQAFLGGFTPGNFGLVIPNGLFFGPASGGGLANAPGVILGANGGFQSISGLVLVNANGSPISTAANQPTFVATATGQRLPPTSFAPGGFDLNSPIFGVQSRLNVVLPNAGASGAGLVGRSKIADNTSPMPRDRVFFDYSAFGDVPLTMNGVNVNRFSPGFEKTFFDGSTSVEMRFPFAGTLNSTIIADGNTSTSSVLFGDMSITGKALLYTDDDLAVSAGLQIAVPTADTLDVRLSNGLELVRITNDTVYLMPFLGALYTPDDRFFTQGFLQFDAPANTNRVFVNNSLNNSPLSSAGTIRDVPFVYVDIGSGYWLYRNDEENGVTGFSTTLELHYNSTLATTNTVNSGFYRIGSAFHGVDMLNLVVGGHLYFNRNTSLTVGYAFPVGNSVDQMFTGELRAFLNYTFGPKTFRAPPSI
jgi:hypothetical protein